MTNFTKKPDRKAETGEKIMVYAAKLTRGTAAGDEMRRDFVWH